MTTAPRRLQAAPSNGLKPVQTQQHAPARTASQRPDQQPLKIRDKARLNQLLSERFHLEFNDLRRCCELDGTPVIDLHLFHILLAVQHGIETGKQTAMDSCEFVAKSNPYNPIARYLDGLRQRTDLTPLPLPTIAAAFGIDATDTASHQLLAHHLAGAVLRGLNPGHKHDQILVFRGEQGTGKSTAIEALAGPWYDSATRVEELESKDFLARINAAWLFEIDECEHTLLKRTASEFKGFLSRNTDRYVEKYERTATIHPRRSVMWGTSNSVEFLNDSTGNRRAWVIDIGTNRTNPPWIKTNRDAIWFTILHLVEQEGLQSHLEHDDPLVAEAAARAQQASLSDAWEEPVAAVLEALPPPTTPGLGSTTHGIALEDLIERALRIPVERINRDIQMRVGRIVDASGQGLRTHSGTVRWVKDKRRFQGGKPRAGFVPELLPS